MDEKVVAGPGVRTALLGIALLFAVLALALGSFPSLAVAVILLIVAVWLPNATTR
ncbi:MAG TPA: hypothetical protein VFZ25_02500 [Chloroflexota bacterium]|nr:hypothetical protein [Chloroflexota bacterium]